MDPIWCTIEECVHLSPVSGDINHSCANLWATRWGMLKYGSDVDGYVADYLRVDPLLDLAALSVSYCKCMLFIKPHCDYGELGSRPVLCIIKLLFFSLFFPVGPHVLINCMLWWNRVMPCKTVPFY